MLRYLLQRIATSLFVLVCLSVVVFMLVRLAPGDTVTAMLGTNYNEADAEALRERYGLDRPITNQYAIWAADVLTGDMGRSTTGKPVSSMIGEAFPVTLQLAMMALAMAIVVGIPLGMLAGATSRPAADASASTIGLLGVSVPGFWLGTMMILLFALMLRWLPPGGFVPLHVDPIENLRHLLMPTVALGAAVTAVVTRMTRASMRRVRDEDYLRTAKAKGVPPHVVWFRHALRNAMLPVLTIAGIQAGYLLGGSVVIEQVFGLPGIGRMALQAIERRDYPLFQGIVLLIGVGFITINLAVDVLYTWFDPRIQIDDQREVA